jgi:hypothetical protein
MATMRTTTTKKSEEERKICFPQFFVVLWMMRERISLWKKKGSPTPEK